MNDEDVNILAAGGARYVAGPPETGLQGGADIKKSAGAKIENLLSNAPFQIFEPFPTSAGDSCILWFSVQVEVHEKTNTSKYVLKVS